MNYFYTFMLSVFATIQVFSQTPITATIPFQGYDEAQALLGQGEYQIFMDTVDGILDKPIIILDGFDPGDTRNINAIYSALGYGTDNLADFIRTQGFDVVILNAPVYNTNGIDIDGGADYIQRNAMVLVELINQINTQKVGSEELVIIGPSMGGLIGRYALAYMEQNGLSHETRLYISFDSPHKGANIPITIQYLFNYLAEAQGNVAAQIALDQSLNSAAAKEMLIDHYSAHLLAGSTYEQDPALLLPMGAPGFRAVFQTELDNLGFPQQTRNVSMINGSAQATPIGSPGVQVVNTTLDLGSGVTADIILNFTPPASQTNTVTDFASYFIGIPLGGFSADSQAFSYTAGVDAAPGGLATFSSSLSGSTDPIIIDFVNAIQQDEYCFIPSISSLAISNESDWYATPDIGGVHSSPFDAYFIPQNNEPHTLLTPENAQFAIDEILNGSLGIQDLQLLTKYSIARNPVSEQVEILLNNQASYQDVVIQVYAPTGQLVYAIKPSLSGNNIIFPAPKEKGIYVVKITDSETVFTKQIVVK
jgi:hypothetical protein